MNQEDKPISAPEPIYANQVAVFGTATDVTIVFGRIDHDLRQVSLGTEPAIPIKDPAVPGIKALQSVTLSMGSAKDLMSILNNVVSQYEGVFGEVKSPMLMAAQSQQRQP